jgi:hypothetical protein
MHPIDWLQALTFEALEHPLGPELASLFSGFSLLIGSELFLTDAGERYIASQDMEADQCPMTMTAH